MLRRGGKNTQELYKKGDNNLDKYIGVATPLEPDILECEVRWDIGSIILDKTSGGNGIPGELFQIQKGAASKVSANEENSTVATRLEKVSFHSNSKEEQCQRMLKLLYNCAHFTC